MRRSHLDDIDVLGRPLRDYAYRYAGRLWVVTPYYNPVGYRTRRRNYEIFVALLRESGIPVLTIECAFGDQRHDLPESVDVVKVRGASLLWQKERLLNLAISWLPRSAASVAWLDCDLIFTDPDWARKTVLALESAPIVQVFETCHQLPRDFAGGGGARGGRVCPSFAHVVCSHREVLGTGRYEDHGHPGYGWAARREILERHGLYEVAIAGSADHYMAHAAAGDLDSPCIARMMLGRPAPMRCFREWAEAFHGSVRGGLGVVPGQVLHLWHGEAEDRKYYLRQLELAELGFDPYTDLHAPPGRPLELRPGKPALEAFLRSYFTERREDGADRARHHG